MTDHDQSPIVPHLEQYVGVWAVEERRFEEQLALIKGLNITAHIQAAAGEPKKLAESSGYESVDGVAVLQLKGFMTKYGSSLSEFRGGTVGLRKAIRAAVRDEKVSGLMLYVESGGGSVMGVDDLALELFAARKKKPVYAYIEDVGASAAYYVASQASRIFANPSADVGSIGVFTVIDDWSAMFAKDGVKRYVVRAGKFKGMATTGTEITSEQLSEIQRRVEATNALFVKAVARGLGISPEQVAELNDGRVHQGEAAVALGMVHEINSFEAAMMDLRRAVLTRPKTGPQSKGTTMSETPTAAPETKAATLKELKAAIKGADDAFLVSCLDKEHTVAQAKDAWNERLQEKLAASAKELEELKAKTAKPAKPEAKTGVQPAGFAAKDTSEEPEDPIALWDEKLAAKMKQGMTKADAASALVKEEPKLHADYIAAWNRKYRKAI